MGVIATTIVVTLFAGTLAIEHQLRRRTSAELLNNRKRVRSWWIIAGLLLLAVYGGPIVLKVLMVSLIFWSAHEASLLLRSRPGVNHYLFIAAVVVASEAAMHFIPEFLLVYVLLPWVLAAATLGVTLRRLAGQYLIYAFLALSLLTVLAVIPLGTRLGADMHSVVLYLFLATALNDVFQYTTGKWLGKRPLAPLTSPNKTIEGALGGVLLSGAFAAVVFVELLSITVLEGFLVGSFLSVLGILGDLNISRLKRAAGVKHTGSAIPGHGGVLDRVDSLTFTAPGFCLCLMLLTP